MSLELEGTGNGESGMPLLEEPGAAEYWFVRSAGELDRLCEELAGAERVAVDTEADSLHVYKEKLCLIQLSYEGEGGLRNCLVDPLAELELDRLLRSLEQREVLMHGASYDLKMLQLGRPFIPCRLVDTEWAAKLLGMKQFSLAHLVGSELGIGLTKAHQKADWGRRPLPEGMQEYAVNDTRFLPVLADRLLVRLEELGRLAWFEECCERMVAGATRRSLDGEKEERWRLTGSGRFQRRELERLRRLWEWREGVAEKLDRPAFRVAGNALLLELAQQGRESEIITGARKFPPRWRMALRRLLEEADRVEETACPLRASGKRMAAVPEWDARLEALRKVRERAAAVLKVDAGVLAPRKALERLAAGEAPSDHLMTWQESVLREYGATFWNGAG